VRAVEKPRRPIRTGKLPGVFSSSNLTTNSWRLVEVESPHVSRMHPIQFLRLTLCLRRDLLYAAFPDCLDSLNGRAERHTLINFPSVTKKATRRNRAWILILVESIG
jgi:hypothetical protein